MAKKKQGQREVPKSARLYLIGPHTVEWSYDLKNWDQAAIQGSESFGEYASRCFAGGRNGEGQR